MVNQSYTDVLVWGTGAYGRLGNGSIDDQVSPGKLKSNQLDCGGILSVSGGLYHSAFVTEDHGVYLFGSNATGCLGFSSGQNDFSADSASDTNSNEYSYVPRRIRSLSSRIKIVQVSVSGDLMGSHTLAVSSQGRLYAWGAAKACGIGAVVDDVIEKPTLVTDFLKSEDSRETATTERVIYASAGGSCSAVITAEGALYTFGITASGRLGYRDTLRIQYRPRRVDALLGEPVRAVSTGGAHMMCVTNRGSLYVWGDNSRGQLGLADLIDRRTPHRVLHPKHAHWSACISAGESHSLAVDANGKLFSWGACGAPCLGTLSSALTQDTERERVLCTSFQLKNLLNSWTAPSEVSVLGDHKIAKIAAGACHSIAVTTTGLVFAWGSKNQVAHQSISLVPRIVRQPTCGDTAAICAGNFHTMLVSSSGCMHFKNLLSTMLRSDACKFHDSFITSASGRKFWINSESLRACVSNSAWESFLEPQIEWIRQVPDKHTNDLSPASDHSSGDSAIDLMLDDWVRDSALAAGIDSASTTPDLDYHSENQIPKDCYFNSLCDQVIEQFFEMVYTDGIPSDGSWPILLRLAVCAQLDRPASILEKRIKKFDRDRTYLNVHVPSGHGRIDKALRKLWNMHGDIVIDCGSAVHVNVLSVREPETSISCHSYMIESDCSKLATLITNDRIQLQYIPVDVMREILYFTYFSEFDHPLTNLEIDFESDVKFWVSVASFGLMCGSSLVHAAALDRVVGLLTDNTWEIIATVVAKYDCVSSASLKQLREAVIIVGTGDIVNRVMKSKTFNAVNTYLYTKSELPSVIERILFELGISLPEGKFLQDLHASVSAEIESHLYIARTLRAELEKYRQLNADPLADEVTDSGVVGTVKRYIKSLRISHKEGPSVFSAFRDTAIFLAMIAIGVAYVSSEMGSQTWLGQTRIAKFVSESSIISQAGILGTNIAFIVLAIYLVNKGLKVRF